MYKKREKRQFYPSLDSEEEPEPRRIIHRQSATVPRATAAAAAAAATAPHLVQPEALPLPKPFYKKEYSSSSCSFAEI